MRLAFVVMSIALSAASAEAKPFHDPMPVAFQGTWAPSFAGCNDPVGVDKFTIDSESVNYYEGNDYLLIGIEFSGAMTRRGGSGALFNGRFTSRLETALMNENNIRMEIDEKAPGVLYRYPIGDDGEPVAAREVRSVRCKG